MSDNEFKDRIRYDFDTAFLAEELLILQEAREEARKKRNRELAEKQDEEKERED